MSRVIGVLAVLVGIFFVTNGSRFARQRVDQSVEMTGNPKWGSPRWFHLHRVQNWIGGAMFLVLGLLAVAGIIEF